MKLLIFVCVLLAADAAKLQGYSFPTPQGNPELGLRQDTDSSNGASFIQQQGGVSLPVISQAGGSASNGQFQFESNQVSGGAFSGQPGHISQSFNEQPTGQVTQISSGINSETSFTSQISGNNQQEGSQGQFQSSNTQGTFNRDSTSGSFETVISEGDCGENQVRHVDGRCVTPEVTRNVFVYAAPQRPRKIDTEEVDIPLPKVEHNIVFIRTDELSRANDPIIVPPPQRKHVIYVLNKESQFGGQRVIEITTPKPKQPEVYFVNYAEGQTPTLPDGIDFQTALNSAVHAEGRFIDGSDGFVESGENAVAGINTGDVGNGFSGGVTTTGGFNEVSTGGSEGNIITDFGNNFGNNGFTSGQDNFNIGVGFSSGENYNANTAGSTGVVVTESNFGTTFSNAGSFRTSEATNIISDSNFNTNEVNTNGGISNFDFIGAGTVATTGNVADPRTSSGSVTSRAETPQTLYGTP